MTLPAIVLSAADNANKSRVTKSITSVTQEKRMAMIKGNQIISNTKEAVINKK